MGGVVRGVVRGVVSGGARGVVSDVDKSMFRGELGAGLEFWFGKYVWVRFICSYYQSPLYPTKIHGGQ